MKNIVEGIDLIIKGLEIIKENFKTQKLIMSDVEKEKISKAQEVEEEIEEIEVEDIKEVEEPEIEESEEVEDEGYTREELEGMKYTELKSLAKDLGVSASGKKVDLIDRILESQEVVEEEEEVEEPEVEEVDVEEESEELDLADYEEFLMELDNEDLIEIAKKVGVIKRAKKKLSKEDIEKIVNDLLKDIEKLDEVLYELGYIEDEDEESVDEEVEEVDEEEDEIEDEDEEVEDIAEEYGLNDMTLEELADICAEYGLSTKGKKQALIDRIVKAIVNGEIEVDDEEEEDIEDDEGGGEDEEEQEVYEEEVDDEEEVDEEEDEEEAEEETKKKPLRSLKNIKREEKEKEVEENIREQYRKKKLKDSKIKKFLDNYNEGDPECKGCKGCTKEDMLECYIDIHKALVDDDGEVNDMEEPYIRDNEYHCCGKELEDLENGNYYCSVCGQEYEE